MVAVCFCADMHAGHCKRLAPTWGELGAAVKDNPTIKIAHVDCTVDRDVCTNAEVSGSTGSPKGRVFIQLR